jgi:hypothetical protein
MLDLRTRGRDVTRFVHDLERWIGALERFNVKGEVRENALGEPSASRLGARQDRAMACACANGEFHGTPST